MLPGLTRLFQAIVEAGKRGLEKGGEGSGTDTSARIFVRGTSMKGCARDGVKVKPVADISKCGGAKSVMSVMYTEGSG